MRKITKTLVRKMKELKKTGIKITEMARILGVSERTINRYTQDIVHPNRNIFILKEKSKKLTVYKANILGYLAAEGCEIKYLSKYKHFDKRRGKVYNLKQNVHRIIFTNKNKILRAHFIKLMKIIYDYEPYCKPNFDIVICAKAVVNDLICYGKFGSRKWDIPQEIMNGNLKLKAAWLRGYGDGDGSVDKTKKEITIKSINIKGLKNVQKLLKNININSHIRGPYGNDYILVIDDKKRYKDIINFLHPEKNLKLENITK